MDARRRWRMLLRIAIGPTGPSFVAWMTARGAAKAWRRPAVDRRRDEGHRPRLHGRELRVEGRAGEPRTLAYRGECLRVHPRSYAAVQRQLRMAKSPPRRRGMANRRRWAMRPMGIRTCYPAADHMDTEGPTGWIGSRFVGPTLSADLSLCAGPMVLVKTANARGLQHANAVELMRRSRSLNPRGVTQQQVVAAEWREIGPGKVVLTPARAIA